jgi:type III pantothenate kinase
VISGGKDKKINHFTITNESFFLILLMYLCFMDNPLSLIAIDAGNTSVKIGVFINGNLNEVFRMPLNDLHQWYSNHNSNLHLPVIISSVIHEAHHVFLKDLFTQALFIDQETSMPFTNNYASPKTAGMDRLCNAAAVSGKFSGESKLVIDIGTCIKFDFIDEKNVYHGGSIAPGLRLRFNSLHQDTGRLPLLNATHEPISLIGNSTAESILSGVQNGIQHEINGMIESYLTQYPDLTIFVTGGDHSYFDFDRKNVIFVDENLTLKGIYAIYSFHAH